MNDICRYKNEPMAVMTNGMHAIGAYYPEKNAVVAWSLTMPVELLIEFAGVVAEKTGVDLDKVNEIHCPCGCPGGTVILADHSMKSREFKRVRKLFEDQVEYCLDCNDQLLEVMDDMAKTAEGMKGAC
jgi:hypothetical protein